MSRLEEAAEAILKAEAEKQGCSLRDMGILSRRRLAHIRQYEVPLSVIPTRNQEDEDA